MMQLLPHRRAAVLLLVAWKMQQGLIEMAALWALPPPENIHRENVFQHEVLPV